jgi:hypothetical protein
MLRWFRYSAVLGELGKLSSSDQCNNVQINKSGSDECSLGESYCKATRWGHPGAMVFNSWLC